jgi:hypothetical protein
MSVFGDIRGELAGKLAAAGLPATTDPGALVPFVLVDLVRSPNPAAGSLAIWPSVVPVKIVAGPPGDAAAAAWLEESLQTVLATCGPAPFAPDTYTGATGDLRLPMYEITYPVNIPNPNC